MKLEDFKINEQWFKAEIIQENKVEIKITLEYLINQLPINKLTKLNTFNFNKLKFDEGKSYNWYFLNNNTCKLLVRQYGTHFTFFSSFKPKDSYKTTISIFTIYDNRNKMDGNTSDNYIKEAIKIYGDVDEDKFRKAVDKEYIDFIKMSYRITQI